MIPRQLEYGGPGRTRTCNQTVMSGSLTKTIIDLAGFSFLFDRVRCGLVRPFLVRNWCGGMGTPNRRSVHLSTPGGPSPHSTLSVEPIFSWARHPLGRRRSRPSASRGTGRFSGAPSLMMSSYFDKTACDHSRTGRWTSSMAISASLSVTSIDRLATSSESTAQESVDSAWWRGAIVVPHCVHACS